MSSSTDVVIIGGGIAGVSAGHFLAEAGLEVMVVEAEAQLAYHTTGRSAALFFESYGPLPIRPLTTGSRPFLESPPEGLSEVSLLSPRGALWLARPEQMDHLAEVATQGRESGTKVSELTPAEAKDLVEVIRPELLGGALWEHDAADMDVAGLHQAFVRGIRRRGGEIRSSAPVTALDPDGTGWTVVAGGEKVTCRIVVNAAGAWCDQVAAMAGVPGVGIVPKRRTAFMVAGKEEWRDWPLVVNVDHDFYFKPDGPQLLCSPADETPSEPCDARADEIDVALAIERINEATTLAIRSVRSAWAGLRSFVADGVLVIGFDPDAPGFFWLAGQGGIGIQTAPGAGRLAAALIAHGAPPADLLELGLDLEALVPDRLRG